MAAPNIYQTIMNAESGGKNVKNYMYDSQHTASGYFQITNTTWASTEAGRNSSVTNAMDAPYATQQAAAGELIQRNGLKDWAPYDHIDGNVSHYDTTPLSGPNGSPTTTPAAPGYADGDYLKTGQGDQYTVTGGTNSTDQGGANPNGSGSTGSDPQKANSSTTPVAIATGADETSAASQANTKLATGTANTIYGQLFAGVGDLTSRIGLIVLGLVLLAGGLWIIASEEGAVPGPAQVASGVRKVGRTMLA